ncbi:hypothetical protein GE061_013494 [Apolygus lucorum]|uniref:Tetraspanin n=1 Tax=Apolygus lucorum TaxID=248454 RepID=A0A8S9XMZ0_APOLU|nr:hypothetical protein GE061_013494 [Apolygus lucorum]
MVVEGGIVVTESSRGKLWRLLCFLGWSEAVVGAVLAFVVYRPTSALSAHLPSSYQSFLHVFYAELIVGLTSAVVAVQGVLVSQASLHNPLKTSTARAYKTWLILGIILVFSLTVALIVVPPAVEAGHNEILEIMKGGVSSYLRKLEWKMSLDKLHQQFRCCGVSSINDWYTSRWIPIRSFRPEVANLQAVLAEDGTLRARVVPASCCDPAVRLPCFHDTLQQNSSPADPRTVLRPETVFTRGCGALVVTPAASTVGPFKVLVITILLLQTGQLVIGRYLYVGTRSVAKCATVSENDRCCSRAKICLSPKRMICNDICSSETSRCSTVCRPRSKKSFCRKRTKTPSCAKSRVGKIGNVIRNVSRSMLCGLSRGSCKSSSGKGKTRKDSRCSRPQTSPSCLLTPGSTETSRKRKIVGKSNLLSCFPVMVDTDANAAHRGGSHDDRLRMTTRTISMKPAKTGKMTDHQGIHRSSKVPVDIRPKLLEGTEKIEKCDFDLLNLNL